MGSLRPDARRCASFIRVKALSKIYRRAVNSREQELYEEENFPREEGSSFVYLARSVHRASRIKDTLFLHFPSFIRGCCCSNVAGAHVARRNIRVAIAVSFISRKTPVRFPSLLNVIPCQRDTRTFNRRIARIPDAFNCTSSKEIKFSLIVFIFGNGKSLSLFVREQR